MNPELKKLVASGLIVLFVSLPTAALAQNRRGAHVLVTRKDGLQVRGELIAVKQDSLLLLSPVGEDQSVEFIEISSVTIAKKSRAGSGFLIGFLLGGIGGGVLGSQGEDPTVGRAGAIILGALLIGSTAGLLGLAIGAAAGSDETIMFEGLSEVETQKVLTWLRGKARMRTAP